MRLPVFRRVPQRAAKISITTRDRHVLEAVTRLGYLTGDQLHRFCFGGKHSTRSWCDERLKRLFHHGYLDRFPRPGPGLGSPQAVYGLGTGGRRLVGEGFNVAHRRMARPQRVRPLFLEHILAINEFRINLEQALRAEGHHLDLWLDDGTLKKMAARQRLLNPQCDYGPPNVPDGYSQVTLRSGHRFCFFLEVDRGTQDRKVFQRKVRAYMTCWERGAYYRQYKTRSFSVLVVVATGSEGEDRRRVNQLVGWTEEEQLAGGENLDNVFWFTSLGEAWPERLLTASIWRVAGKAGLFPLLPAGFEANLPP